MQLDINYTDGTTARIISDQTWKSSTGSIAIQKFIMVKQLMQEKKKPGGQMQIIMMQTGRV
jgi:hypothetical protein